MAKVISSERLYRETNRAYIDASLERYSDFLTSIPTYTVYYSKDHLNSTFDPHLNTVHEVLGSESPVKFNKIDNFPLFNFQPIGITITESDYGSESPFESSAVVIPHSDFKPIVDDLFELVHEGDVLLFRISDVQPARISGQNVYEIQFYLTEINQTLIIANQVSEEYEVAGNELSSKEISILKKSDAELVGTMRSLFSLMLQVYTQYFTSKNHGSVAYDPNDKIKDSSGDVLWFPMGAHAIKTSGLFHAPLDFLKEVHLLTYGSVDVLTYRKSLFHIIQSGDYEKLSSLMSHGRFPIVPNVDTPMNHLSRKNLKFLDYNESFITSASEQEFDFHGTLSTWSNGDFTQPTGLSSNLEAILKFHFDDTETDYDSLSNSIDSYIDEMGNNENTMYYGIIVMLILNISIRKFTELNNFTS